VETTASARKHGISDEDMRHALRHHMQAFPGDEVDFTMFIGPSRTGELLEVGVVARNDQARIVHAMPARHKFRPRT
jgi:hypothetical protein